MSDAVDLQTMLHHKARLQLQRAETALRAHHRVEDRMNGDGTCAVCGPGVWAFDDALTPRQHAKYPGTCIKCGEHREGGSWYCAACLELVRQRAEADIPYPPTQSGEGG